MVQVGEIVGLYLAGALAERYGYRKTLLSLVFMILVIFIVFFVQNISMLMVGQNEATVSAFPKRGLLLNFKQWAIGQLVSQGVLRSLLYRQDDWG
ncbi:maltose permease MAL61 [Apiospora saccharicola]